jgi:hypothetical protein
MLDGLDTQRKTSNFFSILSFYALISQPSKIKYRSSILTRNNVEQNNPVILLKDDLFYKNIFCVFFIEWKLSNARIYIKSDGVHERKGREKNKLFSHDLFVYIISKLYSSFERTMK